MDNIFLIIFACVLLFTLSMLVFSVFFIDESRREEWLKTWFDAMKLLISEIKSGMKITWNDWLEARKATREKKLLDASKKKFDKAFQNSWETDESWKKIHSWNSEKGQMYFINPLRFEEFEGFNKQLREYADIVQQDCEYQITGVTMPALLEGYGGLYVSYFIYKKKSELEEAERLAKLADDRSKQDVDEVESVL